MAETYSGDIAPLERRQTRLSPESEGMNVCPECFSANIYRRVKYASGYKCKKCRGAFDSPLQVERTGAPVGGRGTFFERERRIQRIR